MELPLNVVIETTGPVMIGDKIKAGQKSSVMITTTGPTVLYSDYHVNEAGALGDLKSQLASLGFNAKINL